MLSAPNTLHAIHAPTTARFQQHRTIWQSHRHSHGTYNGTNWVRLERKVRRRVTKPNQNPPHRTQTPLENSDPWRSWSWGSKPGWRWGGFDNTGTNDFEAVRLRAQQRMEAIKREIERDPYAALFGRYDSDISGMRLKAWDKHQHTLADLCRSFFGFEKSGTDTAKAKVKDTDATARVKSEGKKSSTRVRDVRKAKDHVAPVIDASQPPGFVDTRTNDLEFDPISGRMVIKPAAATTTGEAGALSKDGTSTVPDTSNMKDGHPGSLSPTKSSGETTAKISDSDISGVQHKEPEQHANEVAQDHGIPGYNHDPKFWDPPLHEAQSTAKRTTVHDADHGVLGSNGDHNAWTPTSTQKLSTANSTAIGGAPIEITSAVSEPKNENVSLRQPDVEKSNLVDSQQPRSLTPDAQSDEGRKTKGFFYVNKREPEKLKIQDSPQQSEPFLVPENEELEILRASDIRASYPSKELDIKTDSQSKKVDGALEEVKSDENPVTSIDARAIELKSEPQDALGSVDVRGTKAASYTETQSPLQEAVAPQSTQLQARDGLPDSKVLDQTPETCSPIRSEITSPATYRVLAYDPFTMQVNTADTDSSLAPSHEILRPSDVLPRLSNPAQFLPYFEKMRKEGYEIVSGGGDILVFKRFSDVEKKPSDKSPLETKEHGDITAGGAFKDIHEQAALTSPQLTQDPSAEPTKTQSETETPPRKQRSAFSNAIRRMLFTGTAAAGTCYAFGVVTEYFRTGGSDGRGVDAFTVFESERRRRN